VITDSPQFSHRGLNLDVARHYYPVKSIGHLIDSMSFNKFNKLHLHITDSQAWPLEIPSLPDLARKGAYHPSQVYTPKDIESLQRYGALRGIEVYLEIDMPGHTSSIHHAYPDLISAFNVQPGWGTFAAEPPSGTLKLNSTAGSSFISAVLNDILPRTKPYSSLFHTGGDEVNHAAYANLTTDVVALREHMDRFVAQNHAQLRARGITPIVWQEMLLEWDLKLEKDVIVQAWQGGSSVALITRNGYRVIAGTSDAWVNLDFLLWFLTC
jgi:hexosaminidase